MVELLSGPWGPLLIFFLRMVDVTMATMRIILVVRGARVLGPLLGFVEILIWVVTVGAVVRNLGNPPHILGYAAGFSAGTAVGLWVEGKLALGFSTVEVVSRQSASGLAVALRALGFGVTELMGEGREGPVRILYSVVRRRKIPALIRTVEEQDPDAFVTVHGDMVVRRGWLHGARRK